MTTAYSGGKNWVSGAVLAEADLDTYVTDDVKAAARPPRAIVVWDGTGYGGGFQVANNTSTVVLPIDSGVTTPIDTDGFYSSASASRLTVPTGMDGTYTVTGWIEYVSSGTGHRKLGYRVNGSTTRLMTMQSGSSTYAAHLNFTVDLQLSAGDYVEMITIQNSGGNLQCTESRFSIMMQGWDS